MRAVVMREFGPPEVLVPEDDVPDAGAGAGQAIVGVEVANITFVETQVRAGRPPHPSMLPVLPAIPGNGVGGVVDGRRVIGSTGGVGGYAEWAVVPQAGLIPVPDGLGMQEAVALMADGRTAIGLMRSAAVQPGETVLVPAAAGGVGSLLVQLARSAGARVVAAAGGSPKLEVARSVGADVALDYGAAGWAAEAGAVDVAFDGVGGEIGRAAFEAVRPGGRFLPFGMASGAFTRTDDAAARGVTVVRGERPAPETLLELTRAALAAAVAGRLRPVIGQTFPIERAAAAHAAIEARATVGKTLLVVRAPTS